MNLYTRRYEIAEKAYPVELHSIQNTISLCALDFRESQMMTDLWCDALFEACGNLCYEGSMDIFLECLGAISSESRVWYASQLFAKLGRIKPL